MELKEFPRPPADNGIGIHLGFDLSPAVLQTYVRRMQALHVRWSLIAHNDERQLERAARTLASAGIMPVSRWLCLVDQNILDFVPFVQVLKRNKLPAYIQIFNEPSQPAEWRDGTPKTRAFVARWCDHAARVTDAGGYPGLQVLNLAELAAVLTELRARKAQNVIDRMWFCPHPYGANHPPDYPYDDTNQRDYPGATVATCDGSVLQFLEFAPVFEAQLGFVPPFICGEGGWQYGNVEDNRYEAIDEERHAEYHAAVVEWFRSGRLSDGDLLPDYLFAFCPWILYGPEADAWYSARSGTRELTLNKLLRLPEFQRHFTWDRDYRPAPAPVKRPPIIPPEPIDVPPTLTLPESVIPPEEIAAPPPRETTPPVDSVVVLAAPAEAAEAVVVPPAPPLDLPEHIVKSESAKTAPAPPVKPEPIEITPVPAVEPEVIPQTLAAAPPVTMPAEAEATAAPDISPSVAPLPPIEPEGLSIAPMEASPVVVAAAPPEFPDLIPPAKLFKHYVLLGSPGPTQWDRLVATRRYLTRFKLAFGFSIQDARRAERVTIVGDYAVVGAEDEARLKRAKCQVERLLGDLYAIEIILQDRLARNAEFG